MSLRALGLLLIWLGAVILVAVLQQRIRSGAWNEQALDEPPPLHSWAVPATVAGAVLALAGASLCMWSLA